MKICHITSAHARNDTRIFKRQCISLVNAGYEVILVCCDGKPDECVNLVKIHSFSKHPYSKKERFKLLIKNRELISHLLSLHADIYQFHDIELLEVGRKLKKEKQRVIFDSHENWFGYLSKLLPQNIVIQRIGNFLMDFYYRNVVSKFDAIFTVSPNMKDDLRRYSNKIYIVSNYPSIKDISPINRNHDVNWMSFVYAGTVYDISNQINIVKALSKLKGTAKYKIVGRISQDLKNRILETPGNEHVEFINWVNKQELQMILSSSLAGMVLLDYDPICCGKEGQLGSNKIFEYMLAGIPVICTDFQLWKDLIINKYQCGLAIPPDNVDEICKAMHYLLSHHAEAQKMGERGRLAVINEFNWEKGEERYVSIYKDIV